MNRIIVMARDEVGVIADISGVLAANELNIESMDTESLSGHGAISLTTNDDDRALQVLTHAGFKAVTDDSLLVRLRDEPGALAKMAERLRQNGVNIQSLHILDRRDDHSTVAISTSDRAKAESLLDGESIV